ncbi:hypothetical protein LDC_1562, partial [sediment metagenome]
HVFYVGSSKPYQTTIEHPQGVRTILEADALFQNMVIYVPGDKKFVALEPQTSSTDLLRMAQLGLQEANPIILLPRERIAFRTSLWAEIIKQAASSLKAKEATPLSEYAEKKLRKKADKVSLILFATVGLILMMMGTIEAINLMAYVAPRTDMQALKEDIPTLLRLIAYGVSALGLGAGYAIWRFIKRRILRENKNDYIQSLELKEQLMVPAQEIASFDPYTEQSYAQTVPAEVLQVINAAEGWKVARVELPFNQKIGADLQGTFEGQFIAAGLLIIYGKMWGTLEGKIQGISIPQLSQVGTFCLLSRGEGAAQETIRLVCPTVEEIMLAIEEACGKTAGAMYKEGTHSYQAIASMSEHFAGVLSHVRNAHCKTQNDLAVMERQKNKHPIRVIVMGNPTQTGILLGVLVSYHGKTFTLLPLAPLMRLGQALKELSEGSVILLPEFLPGDDEASNSPLAREAASSINIEDIRKSIAESEITSFSNKKLSRVIEETQRVLQRCGNNGNVDIEGIGRINLPRELKSALDAEEILLSRLELPLFHMYADRKGYCSVYVDREGVLGKPKAVYISYGSVLNCSAEELSVMLASALIEKKFGIAAQKEAGKIRDSLAQGLSGKFRDNARKDLEDKLAAEKILMVLRQLAKVEPASIRFISDAFIVKRVYENLLHPAGLKQFSQEAVNAIYKQYVQASHPDRVFKRKGQESWVNKYCGPSFALMAFLKKNAGIIPQDVDFRWFYNFQRELEGYVRQAVGLLGASEEKEIFIPWYEQEGSSDEQGKTESYQTLFDLVFRVKIYVPALAAWGGSVRYNYEKYAYLDKDRNFNEPSIDAYRLERRLHKLINKSSAQIVLHELSKFRDMEKSEPSGDLVLSDGYKGSKYALKLVVDLIERLESYQDMDHHKRGFGLNIEVVFNIIRLSKTPFELENALLLAFGVFVTDKAYMDRYDDELFCASISAQNLERFDSNIRSIQNLQRKLEKECGNKFVLLPRSAWYFALPKIGGKSPQDFAAAAAATADYLIYLTKRGIPDGKEAERAIVAAAHSSDTPSQYAQKLQFLQVLQHKAKGRRLVNKLKKELENGRLNEADTTTAQQFVSLEGAIESQRYEPHLDDLFMFYLSIKPQEPAGRVISILSKFSFAQLFELREWIKEMRERSRWFSEFYGEFIIPMLNIIHSVPELEALKTSMYDEGNADYFDDVYSDDISLIKRIENRCNFKIAKSLDEFMTLKPILEGFLRQVSTREKDEHAYFRRILIEGFDNIYYEIIASLAKSIPEAEEVISLLVSFKNTTKKKLSEDYPYRYWASLSILKHSVESIDELKEIIPIFGEFICAYGVTEEFGEAVSSKAAEGEGVVKKVFAKYNHYLLTGDIDEEDGVSSSLADRSGSARQAQEAASPVNNPYRSTPLRRLLLVLLAMHAATILLIFTGKELSYGDFSPSVMVKVTMAAIVFPWIVAATNFILMSLKNNHTSEVAFNIAVFTSMGMYLLSQSFFVTAMVSLAVAAALFFFFGRPVIAHYNKEKESRMTGEKGKGSTSSSMGIATEGEPSLVTQIDSLFEKMQNRFREMAAQGKRLDGDVFFRAPESDAIGALPGFSIKTRAAELPWKDCYAYLFQIKPGLWRLRGPLDKIIQERFKEVGIGERKKGDIVIYYRGGKSKHCGVVATDGRVESKFNIYHVYIHPPEAVPSSYGTPSFYRRKVRTSASPLSFGKFIRAPTMYITRNILSPRTIIPTEIVLIDHTNLALLDDWYGLDHWFPRVKGTSEDQGRVVFGSITRIENLSLSYYGRDGQSELVFGPVQLQGLIGLFRLKTPRLEGYLLIDDLYSAPWNMEEKGRQKIFSGAVANLLYYVIKEGLSQDSKEDFRPLLVDIESCFGRKVPYLQLLGLHLSDYGPWDDFDEIMGIVGSDKSRGREGLLEWCSAFEAAQKQIAALSASPLAHGQQSTVTLILNMSDILENERFKDIFNRRVLPDLYNIAHRYPFTSPQIFAAMYKQAVQYSKPFLRLVYYEWVSYRLWEGIREFDPHYILQEASSSDRVMSALVRIMQENEGIMEEDQKLNPSYPAYNEGLVQNTNTLIVSYTSFGFEYLQGYLDGFLDLRAGDKSVLIIAPGWRRLEIDYFRNRGFGSIEGLDNDFRGVRIIYQVHQIPAYREDMRSMVRLLPESVDIVIGCGVLNYALESFSPRAYSHRVYSLAIDQARELDRISRRGAKLAFTFFKAGKDDHRLHPDLVRVFEQTGFHTQQERDGEILLMQKRVSSSGLLARHGLVLNAAASPLQNNVVSSPVFNRRKEKERGKIRIDQCNSIEEMLALIGEKERQKDKPVARGGATKKLLIFPCKIIFGFPLAFIVITGCILHEYAHLLTAKILGVRVRKPVIFKNEASFRVQVHMHGEKCWKLIIILLSGPITELCFGIILIFAAVTIGFSKGLALSLITCFAFAAGLIEIVEGIGQLRPKVDLKDGIGNDGSQIYYCLKKILRGDSFYSKDNYSSSSLAQQAGSVPNAAANMPSENLSQQIREIIESWLSESEKTERIFEMIASARKAHGAKAARMQLWDIMRYRMEVAPKKYFPFLLAASRIRDYYILYELFLALYRIVATVRRQSYISNDLEVQLSMIYVSFFNTLLVQGIEAQGQESLNLALNVLMNDQTDQGKICSNAILEVFDTGKVTNEFLEALAEAVIRLKLVMKPSFQLISARLLKDGYLSPMQCKDDVLAKRPDHLITRNEPAYVYGYPYADASEEAMQTVLARAVSAGVGIVKIERVGQEELFRGKQIETGKLVYGGKQENEREKAVYFPVDGKRMVYEVEGEQIILLCIAFDSSEIFYQLSDGAVIGIWTPLFWLVDLLKAFKNVLSAGQAQVDLLRFLLLSHPSVRESNQEEAAKYLLQFLWGGLKKRPEGTLFNRFRGNERSFFEERLTFHGCKFEEALMALLFYLYASEKLIPRHEETLKDQLNMRALPVKACASPLTDKELKHIRRRLLTSTAVMLGIAMIMSISDFLLFRAGVWRFGTLLVIVHAVMGVTLAICAAVKLRGKNSPKARQFEKTLGRFTGFVLGTDILRKKNEDKSSSSITLADPSIEELIGNPLFDNLIGKNFPDATLGSRVRVKLECLFSAELPFKEDRKRDVSSPLSTEDYQYCVNQMQSSDPGIKVAALKQLVDTHPGIRDGIFKSKDKLSNLDRNCQYFIEINNITVLAISLLNNEIICVDQEEFISRSYYIDCSYRLFNDGQIAYDDFFALKLFDRELQKTTATVKDILRGLRIWDTVQGGFPLERCGAILYDERKNDFVFGDYTSEALYAEATMNFNEEGFLQQSGCAAEPGCSLWGARYQKVILPMHFHPVEAYYPSWADTEAMVKRREPEMIIAAPSGKGRIWEVKDYELGRKLIAHNNWRELYGTAQTERSQEIIDKLFLFAEVDFSSSPLVYKPFNINEPGLLVHGTLGSKLEEIMKKGLIFGDEQPYVSLAMISNKGYRFTSTSNLGWGAEGGRECSVWNRRNVTFVIDSDYVNAHRQRFIAVGEVFSLNCSFYRRERYLDADGNIMGGFAYRPEKATRGVTMYDEVITEFIPPDALTTSLIVSMEMRGRLHEFIDRRILERISYVFDTDAHLLLVKGAYAVSAEASNSPLADKDTGDFSKRKSLASLDDNKEFQASKALLKQAGVKKASRVLEVGPSAALRLGLAAARLGAHYSSFTQDESIAETLALDKSQYDISEFNGSFNSALGTFSHGISMEAASKTIPDQSQDVIIILGVLSYNWLIRRHDLNSGILQEAWRVIKNKGRFILGSYKGFGEVGMTSAEFMRGVSNAREIEHITTAASFHSKLGTLTYVGTIYEVALLDPAALSPLASAANKLKNPSLEELIANPLFDNLIGKNFPDVTLGTRVRRKSEYLFSANLPFKEEVMAIVGSENYRGREGLLEWCKEFEAMQKRLAEKAASSLYNEEDIAALKSEFRKVYKNISTQEVLNYLGENSLCFMRYAVGGVCGRAAFFHERAEIWYLRWVLKIAAPFVSRISDTEYLYAHAFAIDNENDLILQEAVQEGYALSKEALLLTSPGALIRFASDAEFAIINNLQDFLIGVWWGCASNIPTDKEADGALTFYFADEQMFRVINDTQCDLVKKEDIVLAGRKLLRKLRPFESDISALSSQGKDVESIEVFVPLADAIIKGKVAEAKSILHALIACDSALADDEMLSKDDLVVLLTLAARISGDGRGTTLQAYQELNKKTSDAVVAAILSIGFGLEFREEQAGEKLLIAGLARNFSSLSKKLSQYHEADDRNWRGPLSEAGARQLSAWLAVASLNQQTGCQKAFDTYASYEKLYNSHYHELGKEDQKSPFFSRYEAVLLTVIQAYDGRGKIQVLEDLGFMRRWRTEDVEHIYYIMFAFGLALARIKVDDTSVSLYNDASYRAGREKGVRSFIDIHLFTASVLQGNFPAVDMLRAMFADRAPFEQDEGFWKEWSAWKRKLEAEAEEEAKLAFAEYQQLALGRWDPSLDRGREIYELIKQHYFAGSESSKEKTREFGIAKGYRPGLGAFVYFHGTLSVKAYSAWSEEGDLCFYVDDQLQLILRPTGFLIDGLWKPYRLKEVSSDEERFQSYISIIVNSLSGRPNLIDTEKLHDTNAGEECAYILNAINAILSECSKCKPELKLVKEEQDDEQGGSSSLKVLYVEDDQVVRVNTQECLETRNFKVTTASDGKEALEIFLAVSHEPFELIITDYLMPLMNGAQLAFEIRKINQNIPIIMITGNIEAAQKAIPEGVTLFLKKPFNPANLADIIKDPANKIITSSRLVSRSFMPVIQYYDFMYTGFDEFKAIVTQRLENPDVELAISNSELPNAFIQYLKTHHPEKIMSVKDIFRSIETFMPAYYLGCKDERLLFWIFFDAFNFKSYFDAYDHLKISKTERDHTDKLMSGLASETAVLPVVFCLPNLIFSHEKAKHTAREVRWLLGRYESAPEVLNNFYFVFGLYGLVTDVEYKAHFTAEGKESQFNAVIHDVFMYAFERAAKAQITAASPAISWNKAERYGYRIENIPSHSLNGLEILVALETEAQEDVAWGLTLRKYK